MRIKIYTLVQATDDAANAVVAKIVETHTPIDWVEQFNNILNDECDWPESYSEYEFRNGTGKFIVDISEHQIA